MKYQVEYSEVAIRDLDRVWNEAFEASKDFEITQKQKQTIRNQGRHYIFKIFLQVTILLYLRHIWLSTESMERGCWLTEFCLEQVTT